MSRLTLIININKKVYRIALAILVVSLLLIVVQFSLFSSGEHPYAINDGYGYLTSEMSINPSSLNGLEISQVPAFDADLTSLIYDATYNDLAVDLTTLDYTNVPTDVYSQNFGTIQNGDYTETYNIIESPYPAELSNYQLPIESLQVAALYAGTYPKNSDQVTIPINIALSMQNAMNLSDYTDVIGTDITYNFMGEEVTKQISGIVSGNTLITIPEKQSIVKNSTAYLIKYSDYNQIEDLEAEYGINILTNRDLKNNAINYLLIIESVLVALIYIILVKSNYKQAVDYLNRIGISKTNYLTQSVFALVPLVIQLSLILILIY